ncbi:MAG: hypothetical protein ONB24_09445 [candidate division KSB1 bacterium]|nr:hypothetical protein [candidate division KSB1 bacterium]
MRQYVILLLIPAVFIITPVSAAQRSSLMLHFGAGLADAARPSYIDRFWRDGVVFHFAFGVEPTPPWAFSFSLTHYTFDYAAGVEPQGDKAGVNVFTACGQYRRPFGDYRLFYTAGFGFGAASAPPVFEKQEKEASPSPGRLLEPPHQNGGPAAHLAIGIERLLNDGAALAVETFAEGIFMERQPFIGFGLRAKIKFTL